MSSSCETSWTLWSQRWHLAWVSVCLSGRHNDCVSLHTACPPYRLLSNPGHIPLSVLLWRRITPKCHCC